MQGFAVKVVFAAPVQPRPIGQDEKSHNGQGRGQKDVVAGGATVHAVRHEAERERRAKVIHAEGELQASEKLYQAAKVLAQEPQAIQLRYLETLTVIGADKNTTIVFPLPMDVLSPFLRKAGGALPT